MQAVILAGGQGVRLLPLTLHTPKPILPILGRPLLAYLVQHLASQGIEEVYVTTGYLGDAIRRVAVAMEGDASVHVVQELEPRGTAGAVFDLLPRLHSPFLVVSGDAVLALDVAALVAAHRKASSIATLAVMAPAERVRFGVVDVAGGFITRFAEKPEITELLPGLLVNSGCYLLEHEALSDAAEDRPVDFAKDVFPLLLQKGHRLGATLALRFWRDIGIPESFREANFEALSGSWPWSAPERGTPLAAGKDVMIDGAVGFGKGVRIGDRCCIHGPAYLGDGVRLADGSEVARSVLLSNSRTSGPCSLRDAVVDTGVSVPTGAAISGALLGRIGAGLGGADEVDPSVGAYPRGGSMPQVRMHGRSAAQP